MNERRWVAAGFFLIAGGAAGLYQTGESTAMLQEEEIATVSSSPARADRTRTDAQMPRMRPRPVQEVGRTDGPLATQIEAARAALIEQGDTARYKEWTLIRDTPRVKNGSEEEQRMTAEWWKELGSWARTEKINPAAIRAAWDATVRGYYASCVPLEEEVRALFGDDVAIAMDGELKKRFELAAQEYHRRLRALLGEGRYARFDELRLKYWSYFARETEHVPRGLE